jgi:hypothetical protein
MRKQGWRVVENDYLNIRAPQGRAQFGHESQAIRQWIDASSRRTDEHRDIDVAVRPGASSCNGAEDVGCLDLASPR